MTRLRHPEGFARWDESPLRSGQRLAGVGAEEDDLIGGLGPEGAEAHRGGGQPQTTKLGQNRCADPVHLRRPKCRQIAMLL